MKKLSLIILTYNSEKDIYDCLKSVYQYNDIDDSLEIIVVDNNSHCFCQMQKRIALLYPDVIIISNNKNGGYGQGNNLGIYAASAPVIAIMNPDVRLIMPVFKEMLHVLSQENVILCGGKQYAALGVPTTSFRYDHHAPAILQSIGTIINRKFDKYNYRRMWLSGAFFVIKRDDFITLGLFDERIFMYGEEYDIHIRIRKNMPSKKIIYLPHLHYLHLIGDRVTTEDSIYKAIKSDLEICQRHNYSPKRCIRRKFLALLISYLVNKALCCIRKLSFDSTSYKVQWKILNELYKSF